MEGSEQERNWYLFELTSWIGSRLIDRLSRIRVDSLKIKLIIEQATMMPHWLQFFDES
jgi:hypothetical protein